MSTADPVPEAVRMLREEQHHHHHAGAGAHVISGRSLAGLAPVQDQGYARMQREREEAAFWEGLRQVIREEVAAVTATIPRTPPPGVDPRPVA